MKSLTRYFILKVTTSFLLLPFTPMAWTQTAPNVASWKTTKHGKHLTVRINPDANLSLYKTIDVGGVAYTGPAKKLKQKDSDKLESLLHDSLAKDLPTARLSQNTSATGTLTLNANITKVKRSHPLVNVITMAAVFIPLDLGDANFTAWIVDQKTGEAVAEIEIVGCGQIYQVLPSLQALGQSKLLLKKESRLITKELSSMNWDAQQSNLRVAAIRSGD
jgi:hypothetical protein